MTLTIDLYKYDPIRNERLFRLKSFIEFEELLK